MIKLFKVLMLAGCLSLLATPASAIPFGFNGEGGLIGYTLQGDGSAGPVSHSGAWFGEGSRTFNLAPGVYSWGIGGIFCPCSWSVTLGGQTIAGGSSWGGGFLSFGRATADTALQVREPGLIALLGLGLFGVWFATRRRKQFS
jgi:hypothetical protein